MTLQNKYKIALIAYRLSGGGGDKVMANLSQFFDSCGIEVYIITVIDEPGYDYKGIVFSTQKHKVNDGLIGRFTRLKALYQYFRKHKFDYIIDFRFRTKNLQELLISKLVYNAPFFLTVHSSDLTHYIPPNKSWANAIYNKAKAVVVITDYMQKKVKQQYDFKHIKLIYNPVDFDLVHQKMLKSIDLKGNFILAVGQMENTIKQFDHLLKAYANSAITIPLVICGDGKLINQYKELANQLNISQNVIFTGFQPNPYAYMYRAKFTVLCSAFEGLPNVLIESLACGTPVVSYNCVSGPNEIIIHEKNGLLVENQNINELALAMNRMWNDDVLYEYCKTNAITSVKKFDLETIGNQWLDLMQLS
ncbi:glycosyltransferase [Avrilella dinanensis]|uniref:Glycosyltransferase n=1 Tax=Avrilella dinanensis TaxID=2008672 RepID=A0A2M9R7U2_9FLAO|nr:glycosyltransferase [Avrilella dinanensis]PJR04932.1 hypothetical protein CDL10_10550 [Avrilella dinanensis]